VSIEVSSASPEETAPLRELYLHEMHCQVIHDSFLRRGFTDPYLLRVDGGVAGYSLVAHRHYPAQITEFYTSPPHRGAASALFAQLVRTSGATGVRLQSNDRLLLQLAYEFAEVVTPEEWIFADAGTTRLPGPPGAVFRESCPEDRPILEARKLDGGAKWVVEWEGEPVAAGGVLFHYNLPYGDVYMAVWERVRRRGFGSFLVQELKRTAYELGKIPAARCNFANTGSRLTLERAGFLPCGRLMSAKLAT
jgi:GNAT superfamily N-acetyltransferase